MTWLLFAGGSVLFFTTLNLLQRIIATDSRNERAMAIVFNVIAGIIALILFTLTGSYSTNFKPNHCGIGHSYT